MHLKGTRRTRWLKVTMRLRHSFGKDNRNVSSRSSIGIIHTNSKPNREKRLFYAVSRKWAQNRSNPRHIGSTHKWNVTRACFLIRNRSRGLMLIIAKSLLLHPRRVASRQETRKFHNKLLNMKSSGSRKSVSNSQPSRAIVAATIAPLCPLKRVKRKKSVSMRTLSRELIVLVLPKRVTQSTLSSSNVSRALLGRKLEASRWTGLTPAIYEKAYHQISIQMTTHFL